MTTPAAAPRPRALAPLAPLVLPLLCLVWAFWTTLVELAQRWSTDPQYSHGFLVPGFAALLLWLRRDKIDFETIRAGLWDRCLGAVLLLLGIGIRLAGTYWFYFSADAIAILPCVAGLVLLVGGRPAWRWAWPAVLFLGFMIPLPFFIASALSGPLQRLATVTGTYMMQTLGLPALAEGNVILLNDHSIDIVEACSGLRMLVVFFALSTAVALLIQKHWIDRVLILASAIPIALVSNIARVTATGILYEAGCREEVNQMFHDAAGWLMMPLGLGLLWLELLVLSRLFIDVPPTPARAANRLPRTNRSVSRPAARRRSTQVREGQPRESGRERSHVTAEPTAD
jgi:exosortase